MADSSRPVPVKQMRGSVTRGEYGKGTKSERVTVFLETGGRRYLLRRKNGPVFADPELERFVGHAVECDGFLVGTTLLADRIEKIR